jgi:hypothetical protein
MRDRMETDHGLCSALVIDGKIDAVDRYQRGSLLGLLFRITASACTSTPHREPHPSRSAAADGSFHRNLIPISSHVTISIYINIIEG